ncbi:TetR/AcrR family transcriptional regulator [Saccharothrix syringae]|uniref:TetR/AcrR family transcriptional regulator n=1 Tax=Saccharothrix syringae TaxID=103733 RepID=A0A5Q0GVM7_SACSY|nr:TetR/AcrR family transcriptional regulator [Saccharothrix syringae]QFZ18176.1 TetR/AcrR family transcriptional regulator [Saccharothrix syringae]
MSRAKSDTKARAQAVARELFLRQGVRRTSLQDIADRLGITKPALYYHFSSREELVRSIVQPLIEDGDAFIAEAEARADDDPRVLLEGYFDFQFAHREVVALMIRELVALADLGLVAKVLDWRTRLAVLLVGEDPPLADATRATVALGGLSDCVMVFADQPVEAVRAAAVAAALDALGR